jgi:hypothetical protein
VTGTGWQMRSFPGTSRILSKLKTDIHRVWGEQMTCRNGLAMVVAGEKKRHSSRASKMQVLETVERARVIKGGGRQEKKARRPQLDVAG